MYWNMGCTSSKLNLMLSLITKATADLSLMAKPVEAKEDGAEEGSLFTSEARRGLLGLRDVWEQHIVPDDGEVRTHRR